MMRVIEGSSAADAIKSKEWKPYNMFPVLLKNFRRYAVLLFRDVL